MYAITGTTGHLGQTLLLQAKDSGISVRAIIRSVSDTSLLDDLCDEIVSVSLDDMESLTGAFRGCDVVIHSAAMIDIRKGYISSMHKVNVQGTENVLEACRRAGVNRLIYISSVEAIDIKNPLRPISELHGFAGGNAIMEYGETKAQASKVVAAAGAAAAAGGDGPETVLICPTAIVGPFDPGKGLSTTMIERYIAGKIPASLPGGFDYVDVRDVAGAAMAAAAGMGRSGEIYLTSGEYLDLPGLFGIIEAETGLKHFTLRIPVWLARLAGFFSEKMSRITGRRVMFTIGSVDILQTDARIDRSKAESELGYDARPMEETVADTIKYSRGINDINASPANRQNDKKSEAG